MRVYICIYINKVKTIIYLSYYYIYFLKNIIEFFNITYDLKQNNPILKMNQQHILGKMDGFLAVGTRDV